MSVLWAIALGVTAAAGLLLVHSLQRAARKQMTVATLRPFAGQHRPTLRAVRVTEKALLLSRLVLFALMIFVIISMRDPSSSSALSGNVLAVVPGTPSEAWQDLAQDAQLTVWLDDAQTPVEQSPVTSASTLSARLNKLDQRLTANATLTVAGFAPAADWPRRLPELNRAVSWRLTGVPASIKNVSGPVAERIVLVSGDAELRALFERSLELWWQAGVLDRATPVVIADSQAEVSLGVMDWVVWAADDALPETLGPFVVALTMSENRSEPDRLLLSGLDAPSISATRLWHALTALPAQQPGANAAVLPVQNTVASEAWAGRLEESAPMALGRMLWWLLISAFVIERLLSSLRRRA